MMVPTAVGELTWRANRGLYSGGGGGGALSHGGVADVKVDVEVEGFVHLCGARDGGKAVVHLGTVVINEQKSRGWKYPRFRIPCPPGSVLLYMLS